MNVETRIRPVASFIADPLAFFDGRVEAHGFFADRAGTVRRRFTASFIGSAAADSIAIDEVLIYDDGEICRRAWALARDGEGWRGTATDVAGELVISRLSNQETRWRYEMDIPLGRRAIRFQVEDCMVQSTPEDWVSLTTIRKFGIAVGRIACTYRRL